MVDRVDQETRHSIMAANRPTNTAPEIEVRKALFRHGLRYRIHDPKLPGKPDMVLTKSRVVVFVNGCFWHGHQCKRKPKSKTNRRFWTQKIRRNRRRDLEVRNKLINMGWRILVVWECAVRRQSPRFSNSASLKNTVAWIKNKGRLCIVSESGFEECL